MGDKIIHTANINEDFLKIREEIIVWVLKKNLTPELYCSKLPFFQLKANSKADKLN